MSNTNHSNSSSSSTSTTTTTSSSINDIDAHSTTKQDHSAFIEEIYKEAKQESIMIRQPTFEAAKSRVFYTTLIGGGIGLLSGLNFGYRQGIF